MLPKPLPTSIVWFSLPIAFHTPGRPVFLFGQENSYLRSLFGKRAYIPFCKCSLEKMRLAKKTAGLITYSSPARAQFLISLFPIHPETPGQQLQRARMRQRESGTEDLVRGVRPRGRNQHSVLFRKEFSG